MKQAVEMPVLWKARKTIVPFSALPTKTLKIEKTDFHIPTATTTTEQSFHLKTRKTGPDNRSHLISIIPSRCSRICSGQSNPEQRRTKAFNSMAATHSIENSYSHSISIDFDKAQI